MSTLSLPLWTGRWIWLQMFGYRAIVGHVLGMGGGEAYAHVGRGFGHGREKTGEGYGRRSVGRLEVVGVDVLPQESHLTVAFGAEVGKFGQNGAEFAGAFATAGVRHYAVAAEIVAAAHDRDESSDEISGQAHGEDIAVGLRGAQRDVDGFLSRFGGSEERGEVEIAVRAGHKVDSVVFDEVFAHAFGHASDDSYYQSPRGAFASQRLEKLQP